MKNFNIDSEIFPKLAELTEQELLNKLHAVKSSPLAMLECKATSIKLMSEKLKVSEEFTRIALDSKTPNAVKMYANFMQVAILSTMEASLKYEEKLNN